MDIDGLLTAEELTELEERLTAQPEAMSFWRAEGFLTGVASAPNELLPSDWVGVVLGTTEFATEENAMVLFALLLRRANHIGEDFANQAWDHPPSTLSDDELREWCAGYMQATALDDQWKDDIDAMAIIHPIGVISGDFEPMTSLPDENGEIPEDDGTINLGLRNAVPNCVEEIINHWMGCGPFEDLIPIRRTEPKVGRNDPCPCGSGKKFKRCCGRNPQPAS